jgi:hypothetical protein
MRLKNCRTGAAILTVVFALAVSPLYAQADHVRIRTIAGMEPIGRLTASGYSGGGESSWGTTYGFSPGLEVNVLLGDRVEVGAGAMYQVSRRVLRDSGESDESFSFIPVYIDARVILTMMEIIDTYFQLNLGYSLFQASQGFKDIWSGSSGGSLTSTTGGIYVGGVLGATLNLEDNSKWGLDFSMDVGYGYHGATGKNSSGSHPISYQVFSTNIALDWHL